MRVCNKEWNSNENLAQGLIYTILTEKTEFGLWRVTNHGEVTRTYTGELMETRVIFSEACLCKGISVSSPCLQWCKLLFFCWYGGHIFTKADSCPAFRQRRGDRELFLHLLTLSCLQLEITLMPEWPIWGWHSLSSFRSEEAGVQNLLFDHNTSVTVSANAFLTITRRARVFYPYILFYVF